MAKWLVRKPVTVAKKATNYGVSTARATGWAMRWSEMGMSAAKKGRWAVSRAVKRIRM